MKQLNEFTVELTDTHPVKLFRLKDYTSVVDRRKDGTYGRSVQFSYRMEIRNLPDPYASSFNRPDQPRFEFTICDEIKERVQSSFRCTPDVELGGYQKSPHSGSINRVKPVTSNSHRDYDDKTRELVHFKVNFWLPSEKPSKTLSEKDALALLDSDSIDSAVVETISTIVPAKYAERLADWQAEKRAKEASRIFHNSVENARKKAKEICRYEQRLAALEAELKAEMQAQLRKKAKSYRERMAANDGVLNYDDDSQKAVDPIVVEKVLGEMESADVESSPRYRGRVMGPAAKKERFRPEDMRTDA